MKMIKGNVEKYVTSLSSEEVRSIIGVLISPELNKEDVMIMDDITIVDDYMIDTEMFLSIYELTDVTERDIEDELFDIKEVEETCDCTHVKALDVIKEEIEETKKSIELFRNRISAYQDKLYVLEGLLEKIEG